MTPVRLLTALLLTLTTGCSITINSSPPVPGSGVALTEEREITSFEHLSVSAGVDVVVTCGGDPTLSLTSDDNIVPLIRTTVVGDTLKIESDHNLQPNTRSVVNVTVPQLSSISVAGSGDVSVKGMQTTDAGFSVSGSGTVTGDVNATSIDVSVAGSGDVTLSGQSGSADVSIAGSGNANLTRVQADNVSVSIAGSGDVDIHANKRLDISIAGSGSVTYSGAAVVERTVLGSGDIRQRDIPAEKESN